MELKHTIEINAPQETVFQWISEHERLPLWISTLQSTTARSAALVHVGEKFTQHHLESGKNVEFEGVVAACEAPKNLTLRCENKDAIVDLAFQLEATSSGTALTQNTTATWKSLALRLMAGAFQSTIEERMTRDLGALKALCEGESS